MEQAKLDEVLGQSVAAITEQLPTLSRDDLVALSAAETARGDTKRSTLLLAIDKQLAVIDNAAAEGGDDAATAAAAAEKAAADAKAAELASAAKAAPAPPAKLTPADWRHPDYAGPLTGGQANWRVNNIKPVKKVVTK